MEIIIDPKIKPRQIHYCTFIFKGDGFEQKMNVGNFSLDRAKSIVRQKMIANHIFDADTVEIISGGQSGYVKSNQKRKTA